MECQPVILGNEAKNYIASQLQDGLYLARSLARAQIIGIGSIITYAESSTNQLQLQQLATKELSYGGVMSLRHSLICASRFISDFLAEDKNRLCIFENYNADPTPVWLERLRSHTLIFGQEVYNIVCGSHANERNVMDAIQESKSSWIFIGCMTSIPDAESLLMESEISEHILDTFAKNAEHIIVGAFDGEGYLLWTRTAMS